MRFLYKIYINKKTCNFLKFLFTYKFLKIIIEYLIKFILF